MLNSAIAERIRSEPAPVVEQPTRFTSPPVQIGAPAFDADEMREALREFSELYERRPIRDNPGGMSSTHLFLLWFALRELQPEAVIESGVLRGLGTWVIEQAVPDAKLYCIDLDWRRLEYRSTAATYLSRDFAEHDWIHLDGERTVAFFDDHVNAMTRLEHLAAAGIRHAIFEDNYPPGQGDCYSLKTALAGEAFRHPRSWRYYAARAIGRHRERDVPANPRHELEIRRTLECYQELPPMFWPALTRWGTEWSIPTPAPLLWAVTEPWQRLFEREARWYTWMAYVRLH